MARTVEDPAVRHGDLAGDEEDQRLLSTEHTPLLRTHAVPEDPRHLYRQNATILCFASIFLIELGYASTVPPWNALAEDIICSHYVPRIGAGISLADDPRCKIPAVQGELATIRGWQMTFECIPGAPFRDPARGGETDKILTCRTSHHLRDTLRYHGRPCGSQTRHAPCVDGRRPTDHWLSSPPYVVPFYSVLAPAWEIGLTQSV